MKYLKTFEDLNQDQTDFDELDDFVKQMTIENKKYWKVKFSDLNASLYKLGIPYIKELLIKIKKNFSVHYNSQSIPNEYIYITYNMFNNKLKPWSFVAYNGNNNDFLKNADYTYMGEVEITPEDIESYKFWEKTQKYNL